MSIRPKTVWQYKGPYVQGCPQGQLHLVVLSDPQEIVTVGMPFGTGGAWLGDVATFHDHFAYKGDYKEIVK